MFILSTAGFEDLVREMGEPARELSIPPEPEARPDEAEMQQMAAIAVRAWKRDTRATAGAVGTLGHLQVRAGAS